MSASTKCDAERSLLWPRVGIRANASSSGVGPRLSGVALVLLAPGLLALSACSSSDSSPRAGDAPDSSTTSGPVQGSTSDPDSADEKSDDSNSPDPTATGPQDTSSPGSEPTGAPVPEQVRQETKEATDDFIDVVSDVLKEPDSTSRTVPSVTGAALEELHNRVVEYENSGWRVVGEAVIVRQKVVKYVEDPETAVVRACVDNSEVRVVDAKGNTVPGSKPARARTLNVFTVVKEKDTWVISESRLASQPDC